jgi:hypothetical protein
MSAHGGLALRRGEWLRLVVWVRLVDCLGFGRGLLGRSEAPQGGARDDQPLTCHMYLGQEACGRLAALAFGAHWAASPVNEAFSRWRPFQAL